MEKTLKLKKVSHPVFSAGTFPNKNNIFNGRYWLFYLNNMLQHLLNVFYVNPWFHAQKDGVRRVYSHIGLYTKATYETPQETDGDVVHGTPQLH